MSRFLEALSAPGGVIPSLSNLVSAFVDRKSQRESNRRADRNEQQAAAFRNRQQGLLEQRFAMQQSQAQAQQEARITKAKTDQANKVARHKREQAENLAGAIENARALTQQEYEDAADIVSGNSLFDSTEGTKGTWHPKELVDAARAIMARKYNVKSSEPGTPTGASPEARLAGIDAKIAKGGPGAVSQEDRDWLLKNDLLNGLSMDSKLALQGGTPKPKAPFEVPAAITASLTQSLAATNRGGQGFDAADADLQHAEGVLTRLRGEASAGGPDAAGNVGLGQQIEGFTRQRDAAQDRVDASLVSEEFGQRRLDRNLRSAKNLRGGLTAEEQRAMASGGVSLQRVLGGF